MMRKWIGRVLAGTALAAGLVALASQVTASDHARGVPAAGNHATTANAQTGDSGELALDLNHWQEARLVTGSGSKFKPGDQGGNGQGGNGQGGNGQGGNGQGGNGQGGNGQGGNGQGGNGQGGNGQGGGPGK